MKANTSLKELWARSFFLLVLCAAGSAWGQDLQISGKVAFWTSRDGNWEIYTMNADGSGQTRLTNNSAFDGSHPGRRMEPRSLLSHSAINPMGTST